MDADALTLDEHAHRAYVASLASQLVPDALASTDDLVSLALPPPSQPLTPFAIGHDERNIDFWDGRKVREWEKGVSEVERWEMSKGQVEEVKRVRKELEDAVKKAEEDEKASLTADNWLFPPRLSDDLIRARADRARWEQGMAAFEPSKVLPKLLEPLAETLPLDINADLVALDIVPGQGELYDLTLVATTAQLAHVKETRQDFVQKAKDAKGSGLGDEEGQELREISPRLVSPPIFPRPKASFVDSAVDSVKAFLPSEISAYPFSPRGSDYLRAAWDQEDRLDLPPSSPPTSTRSEKVSVPAQVWSSSQVGDLPHSNEMSIELPVFGRERQVESVEAGAESWWEDVSAFDEDEVEIDQLDSDLEENVPSVTTSVSADPRQKRKWDVLSSDQTIGERPWDEAGDLIVQSRLPLPKLVSVSTALQCAPALPRPADFARKSGTPFAQSLLPGLRSLTIELSWQAWRLPPGETLEDLLVEADTDFPAPHEVHELFQPTNAASDNEEEDLASDHLTTTATLRQSSSDETLTPRVKAFGLDSKYFDRQELTDMDDRHRNVAQTGLTAGDGEAQQDEAEAGAAALVELASSGALDEELPPAQGASPRGAEPLHPPSDESSDFGFIFPSSSLDGDDMHVEPASFEVDGSLHVHGDDSRSSKSARADRAITHASPPSPAAENEPLLATGSTWSIASALDRFLKARGVTVPSGVGDERPARRADESARHELPVAPPQRSSPPPGAISFTTPPFLVDPRFSHSESDPIRVVGFDAIFQMRSHFLALQEHGILPVHRPSRFAASSSEMFEPHLIVHPSAAVLFIKLASIIGNAVPSNSTNSSSSRSEPLFTTIQRLAERFDRLVVILEEQQTRVGSVKSYSFTPPVLAALDQLATALSQYRDGQHSIELALSKGAGHSADITRRFVEWQRGREATKEDLPVLDLWDERTWLPDDPTEDEAALLQQPDLNELSASAILAIASLNDFLGMSASEKQAVFGSIVGIDRINRISDALGGAGRPQSAASFKSLDLVVQPPNSLSAVAASGQDGVWAGDNLDDADFDFSEFVDISQ